MSRALRDTRAARQPRVCTRFASRAPRLVIKAYNLDSLSAPVRLPVHLNDLSSTSVLSSKAASRPDIWTRARHGLSANARQGFQEHVNTLREWESSYSGQAVRLLEAAVDEERQEAFLFLTSHTYNTGSLWGRAPTCRPSEMAGLYRIKYDAEGLASDVWQFRTASVEEREALLGPSPPSPPSPWLPDLQLLPCTWTSSPDYPARMRTAVELWSDAICTRTLVERLHEVVADDVVYVDCLDLQRLVPGREAVMHHDCVLVGAEPLARRLQAIREEYEQCAVQLRSVVLEPGSNKAFVHWSQGLTSRDTGRASVVEGASLLVFDSDAKVVQLLDFSCPPSVERRLMAAGAALSDSRSSVLVAGGATA